MGETRWASSSWFMSRSARPSKVIVNMIPVEEQPQAKECDEGDKESEDGREENQ